jgi:ATP-dependent helicase/nuclease subunit A
VVEASSEEDVASTLYRFRRNLVVVASAGTGKTHALVGVLVHLAVGACESDKGGLRDPIPLTRAVATTFSRKAAGEIRGRLVRELTRLASVDRSAAYRADLLIACDRAGVSRFADDELAARARRALDTTHLARIGTLHSLATTIVRAGNITGGRAPNFDLEGEEDAADRARDAVSRALEELLLRDPRGAASLAYLAGGIGPLVDRAAEVLERLSEDGRGASELAVPRDDARSIEGTLEKLVRHAERLSSDESMGSSASALCEAWAARDPDRLEEAASNLCAVAARGRRSEEAQTFFDFRAGLPGLTHAERGRNLVKLWKMRHRLFAEAELMKTLLVDAEKRLRASRARDSVLSYGDVLQAARDVLAGDPDVAMDLGAGLDAFLVDEFQDTSRTQREIVELLWQDHMAKDLVPGSPSPRIARVRPRGLFVVGDRKQSIYGFRGADVGSFAELCIGLAGRPARDALRIPRGRVWEPEEPTADFVALRHNRRSAPEILSFVNAYSRARLVAASEPAELYEVEYAPEVEDLSPPRDAAWGASGGARVSWIRLPPGTGPASSRASEADAVARRIHRILSSGSPRVRGMPATPRDIAVLAQRNGMLEAVSYALARAEIPYVVAGNGFFSAREVKDMLALLSMIVDPDDTLARVSVLRGAWCGVSDETLVALTDPHSGVADVPAWGDGARRRFIRAEDKPHLEALREVVLRLRGVAAAIGPAETLRQAVVALSFEETLVMLPRGEQRVANVRKLLALAEGEPNPWAFLSRMSRATDEELPEPLAATFSETDNAVRLLTVHASKGLDFPIVLLPEAGAAANVVEQSPIALQLGALGRDLGRDLGLGTGEDGTARIAMRVRDEDGRLHDTPSFAAARRDLARRELAERARLAYVAATRAREAVVFVGDRRAAKAAITLAYRSTAAAALLQMTTEERTRDLVSVQDGPDEALSAELPESDPTGASPLLPTFAPSCRSVALTACELADFAVCPRRFQLNHLLCIPPPQPDLGASSETLAGHFESAYERRARREGARVTHRLPYLAEQSEEGVMLAVRGEFDLWVERPEGATEVIVFAKEPFGPSLYSEVLAKLAPLACTGMADIRVGTLTNKIPDEEPTWYPEATIGERQAAARRALAWTRELVHARWTRSFARAPLSTCQSIGCGYVAFCHPAAHGGSATAIPPSAR